MTRDLRTLIYLLNLELREESGIQQADVCNRGAAVEADAIGRAAVEADAIGEQQLKRTQSGKQLLKRTQSGSSSRSGRDREQQLKQTILSMSRCKQRAAAGSGGKRPGEQQWKPMPQSGPGAAAEADASGEQQLKRTQSGRSTAVRRRITHGRRTKGK